MLVYNVTLKVEKSIIQEWVEWMKGVHIPEVLSTGCFTGYKFLKLISEPEDEGVTFAVQYFASEVSLLNVYFDKYAGILRKSHEEAFKDKFVAFRTILQEV
ncbi:MAG: DUF4286 family protein [Cyanobacteria bacterium P01_H01_bin.74]